MARDHEPTQAEATFVIRAPRPFRRPAATRGFAERLALFVSGVDRANADELLCGLTGATKRRAAAFAKEATGWDSATRQGRMAVAFGPQPRSAMRLKELLSGASPLMRQVLFRRLAPWQQSLFPMLRGAAAHGASTPAMEELAERLIREATR